MFRVYNGLTFGEDYAADGDYSDPTEALKSMEGFATACIVLEQTDERHTLLFVKVGNRVFNCLTGQVEKA